MDVESLARKLHDEATTANERRLLVFHGDRDACYAATERALSATVGFEDATLVGDRAALPFERLDQHRAADLLGETRRAVVYDAHDACRPNVLGTVAGVVDGGGFLVLLAPSLATWPDHRDGFDEGLAVPPYDVEDVTGHFRRRLVETVRAHDGVAVVDVDEERVEDDGLTHPAPRARIPAVEPETRGDFPQEAYEMCLTDDQVEAVRVLEALRGPGTAVVVEADRGRGKSSAAGIAAGALAADGRDVLVTAPRFRNAAEVFERARELLDELGQRVDDGSDRAFVEATAGGRVRFATPVDAADQAPDVDALVVDEAAALSVDLLEDCLAAPAVAFATTVHGYEGAGRGFSVRFRDRLDRSDRDVLDLTMLDPIRYAAGDPVEVWSFHALLLDARPPVDEVVTDAELATVRYRHLSPTDLVADEHLLRQTFGLLVFAHYRTEPDDLARLLDAPNLVTRALTFDGRVVAVCLLAREGNLPTPLRARMYEGGRVRGNMLPDVLTSQLRDEDAGVPQGLRVMRIATHPATRRRGLGSRLLDAVHDEFAPDYFGTGYGATPGLLRFWHANDYHAVHLSTRRNETSGEHSAIMLRPETDAGRELAARHAEWFAERVPGVLADPLDGVDPDVVRAVLRTVDATRDPDLSEMAWKTVAGAAYGPGLYDMAPGPFVTLVTAHLLDPTNALTPGEERLLVRKVLQAHDWPAVADELGYHSTGHCMRALGEALVPLVDRHGDATARAVRDRFPPE